MSDKRKSTADIDAILQRPWCYYCERDFDDLNVLIQHQKAKHFKCESCNRRLNTAGGLSVHLSQVHKESLTVVDNSLPNRGDVSIEIFGMEGMPADVLKAHQDRILDAYFRAEAEHRARTGNPTRGTHTQGIAKRAKTETREELKARLAVHKAKKAAEKAGRASNPTSPANAGAFGAPTNPAPALTPPEGQTSFQPPSGPSTSPSPGFTFSYPPPGFAGSPSNSNPFSAPGQGMPVHSYGGGQPQHAPFSAGPTVPYGAAYSMAAPMGFGRAPSAGSYGQPWSPPALSTVPTPAMSAPGMTSALPQPAAGLPPRPSFQAPNLSKEEMAAVHAGRMPELAQLQPPRLHPDVKRSFDSRQPKVELSEDIEPVEVRYTADRIDDFIDSVTRQSSHAPPSTSTPAPSPAVMATDSIDATNGPDAVPTAPASAPTQDTSINTDGPAVDSAVPEGKISKKKKEKHEKQHSEQYLVYSDTHKSPEEKKAEADRYAFEREDHTQTVVASISGGGFDVADDMMVRDPQDAQSG